MRMGSTELTAKVVQDQYKTSRTFGRSNNHENCSRTWMSALAETTGRSAVRDFWIFRMTGKYGHSFEVDRLSLLWIDANCLY